ncbi:M1 aminopeptidase family protein [Pedobacter duraquae]|uniref:Peptidase M1 membrane alanine aminopeptidase domain-containing protein n=1 Tax=Pedobacter duraquae TaxID=425511 RepID=A0A4R6IPB6_9SPHI|nr:hypothetical protein [Pedobacter duraquae]TDO23991.1 hypothetical protein CLV32_0278 [Pedobacter duraquae]
MKQLTYVPLVLFALFSPIVNLAQEKNADRLLNEYIISIDSAFQRADTVDFNKLIPLAELQSFYQATVNKKFERKAGLHRIIKVQGDSAFALITGAVLYGNSGDETNTSVIYSGIYKFKKINGSWIIAEKLAIDRLNKIKRQSLNLKVTPGAGIIVSDTLTIDVSDPLGFAVRFNHHALISGLTSNGQKLNYLAGGGLLWVNTQLRGIQKIVLNYSLAIEKDDNNRNSGYFGDIFGHVRNQYCWHPFFSFSSANDRADFSVHAEIPATYGISTTLPQQEAVEGQHKIVSAKSDGPIFALGLYYDKEWETTISKKDDIALVVYATKDFRPDHELLYQQFSKVYDTLQRNFGKPQGNYFGILQDRSSGGNGWKNRSNSVIIAAETGGYIITDKPSPRAIFGHEIAHQWTNPNGAATNFLTEGWATYAESILLKETYGDTIVRTFFKSQKLNYINGKFDGHADLLNDYGNSGVSYSKGSWLFYLLQQYVGEQKLAATMSAFSKLTNQSVKTFIAQLNINTGKDLELFVNSWLHSKVIPTLSVEQAKNTLTIIQESDVFIFPLTVQATLKNGKTLKKKIVLSSRTQTVHFDGGTILSYKLDPDDAALFFSK